MKQIGSEQGVLIYWSDPQGDGGRGTGEVMVGPHSAGNAQSKSEAMQVARRHIEHYNNKNKQ